MKPRENALHAQHTAGTTNATMHFHFPILAASMVGS